MKKIMVIVCVICCFMEVHCEDWMHFPGHKSLGGSLLLEDAYLFHTNNQIYLFDKNEEKWKIVKIQDVNGKCIYADSLLASSLDSSGNVWFKSNIGLLKYNRKFFELFTTENSAIFSDNIRQICGNVNGGLFVIHELEYTSESHVTVAVSIFKDNDVNVCTKTFPRTSDKLFGFLDKFDRQGYPWFQVFEKTYEGNMAYQHGHKFPVPSENRQPDIVFGPLKFDGETWMELTEENSGLPTKFTGPMTFDSENRLWVYFNDNYGVGRYDGENWLILDEDVPMQYCSDVLQFDADLKDNLWMMKSETGGGPDGGDFWIDLFKWDGEKWSSPESQDHFQFDRYGNEVVYERDTISEVVYTYLKHCFKDDTVRFLMDGYWGTFIDYIDNTYWFVTDMGLIKYYSGEITKYKSNLTHNGMQYIGDIQINRKNEIFLGSNDYALGSPVYKFNTSKQIFEEIEVPYKIYFGDRSFLTFCFDNDDILWGGTNRGLLKYYGVDFEFIEDYNSEIEDVTRNERVEKIVVDKQNRIFFSTGRKNWNFVKYEKNIFTVLDTSIFDDDNYYYTTDLHIGKNGNVIAGIKKQKDITGGWDYPAYLSFFDGKDWKHHLLPDKGFGKSGLIIDEIAQDNLGNTWCLVYYYDNTKTLSKNYKVFKFDGENWAVYTELSSLFFRKIYSITADANNNIWLGTSSGLVKFNGDNTTIFDQCNSELPHNTVNKVAVDKFNNIIISWNYNGLSVFNENEIVLTDIKEVHYYSDQIILTISPNPFSQFQTTNYELREAGHVTLKVLDMLGNEVLTLIDGFMPAGWHEARFDAAGLPEGMYILKLQAGSEFMTRKVVKF